MMTIKQPQTLKNRKDFLRLRQSAKWVTPHFILQSGKNAQSDFDLIRFGYTASKKVGNAVARNRAKRRMRALVRLYWPDLAKPGYDYVVIARPALIDASFQILERDMEKALKYVNKPRRKSQKPS